MAPLGLCLESHSAASKSHRSSVSRTHSHCGASGGAIVVALLSFSPKYFRVFSEDLLYLCKTSADNLKILSLIWRPPPNHCRFNPSVGLCMLPYAIAQLA